MLNALWAGFFLIAFAVALFKTVFLGEAEIFSTILQSTFTTSKTAFEIALGLTGVMTLWLGILRVGERAGMLRALARALGPLLRRLFPHIPPTHPALGSVIMNMSANMLGLDNAATPLGIRAMQELQELNPHKETASNAQILFVVINTASVTLFPITVFTYRAQLGAADPTDVFIPILLSTYAGTLAGLAAVALAQRIDLFDRVLLAYLGVLSAAIAALVVYFLSLPQQEMLRQSGILSGVLLFGLIVVFIAAAMLRKIDAFAAFIEGAKEGFTTAVTIIPYLVAMLVAIGVFRASGALDLLLAAVRQVVDGLGLDNRFVDGLPTALMKPLSGSGARAMMIETMQTEGADSFAGRLASVLQGSSETTFYVIAVYFGAIGIRYTRHTVACALFADVTAITAAIGVSYVFFA